MFKEEVSICGEQQRFIVKYPLQFLAAPQDVHAAHGYRASFYYAQLFGASIRIELLDRAPSECVGLEADHEQFPCVGKIIRGVAPLAHIGLRNIVTFANPLVIRRQLPVQEIQIALPTSWIILEAFRSGCTTVRIFDQEYSISDQAYNVEEPDILLTGLYMLQTLILTQSPKFRVGVLHRLHRLGAQGSLIVNAAGDRSLYQSSFALDLAVELSRYERLTMINVVGLAQDGAHLLPTSNQPGLHTIATRTLAAVAVRTDVTPDKETMNAAGYVAACAAAIKTELPALSWAQIGQSLLLAATPVVLVTDTFSAPFDRPVVLEGTMARDFAPGLTFQVKGTTVHITADMYAQSRRKYGMGRVNLRAALELARDLVGEDPLMV
jgi:hypothetical protein